VCHKIEVKVLQQVLTKLVGKDWQTLWSEVRKVRDQLYGVDGLRNDEWRE
jgi:hypothetical protein